MTEFLGGRSPDDCTSAYVSRCDDRLKRCRFVKSPRDITYYLDRGMDVSRSLWDKNALIAHIDIEYVNFDFPQEAFNDPMRIFTLQQPVEKAAKRLLSAVGIRPLHMLSGRGHHFVWRIKRDSKAFEQLKELGEVPGHLKDYYRARPGPENITITPEEAAAFSGLGLVMEFTASRIRADAGAAALRPVTLTDIKVGPQQRGRESISIDISEYGDPLSIRIIRIPFSVYLKHKLSPEGEVNFDSLTDNGAIFSIPLEEMSTFDGVSLMRDAGRAMELARHSTTSIPEESVNMLDLIEIYKQSPLSKFHRWFYSQEQLKPEDWPREYDQAPLGFLPDCIKYLINNPNPLLLQPAGIRQLVCALLAIGWHPRRIAGFLRSKYERDYGWGGLWLEYDAATRADFYTRFISGLIIAGGDEAVDFNCVSTKEKQFCFMPEKRCGLGNYHASLMKRKDHERLGCGPVNGLFL